MLDSYNPIKFCWVAVIGILGWFLFVPGVWAQQADGLTYQVVGQAAARDMDFVKARKRALNYAFQNGLEFALKDIVGASQFKSRRREMQSLLEDADRFVQSYRYLEAHDSVAEKISRVKIEVTYYKDALNRKLARIGFSSTFVKERSVLILVNEKSLSSEIPPDFWEYIPMAEVAMLQNFLAAGIKVIGRDKIRELVDEELVIDAARGDLAAAVEIGLKAGAEIVVVGNAVSSRIGETEAGGPQTIQANLSMKAVSTIRSTVVAAKSDFAVVKALDEFSGELDAYEKVSRKMADFLIDTLKRYWNPPAQTANTGGESPATEPDEPVRQVTPKMLNDL